MKRILPILAALAAFLAVAPAMAETRILYDCEIHKAVNGNYWFKTDPTCTFSGGTSEHRGKPEVTLPDREPQPPTDPVDPTEPDEPDEPTDPVEPTEPEDPVEPPPEDDDKDNNGHGNGDEGDCSGSGCTDPDNPGKDKPKKP